MSIDLLPISLSFIIYIVVICTYLTIQKKEFYKTKRVLFDCAFAILSALVGVYSCLVGHFILDNKLYSLIFLIMFVSSLIFEIKELVLVFFIESVVLFMQLDVADNLLMQKVDFVSLILSGMLGYVCKKTLYKKTWPSIITCLTFSILLTSLYMLVEIVILSNVITVEIYDTVDETLLIKFIENTVGLFIIFLIFNTVFKKYDINAENDLMHKVFKKYNLVLLVAYFVLVTFAYVFYHIYMKKRSDSIIYVNYTFAKETLNNNAKKYGDLYSEEKEKLLKATCSNWLIGEGGAIYVIDRNDKVVNYIDEKLVTFYHFENCIPKSYDELSEYPSDKLFDYNLNGNKVRAIYFTSGSYRCFIFMTENSIYNKVITAAYLSSFTVVIVMVIMFVLITSLLNKLIVLRLKKINGELSLITDGNYDVVLTDESSTEFYYLSNSINKTVETLKLNIKTIEDKNREELELARRIQVSQMSAPEINTIGYQVYASNTPAEEVGGDYYDFFFIDHRYKVFIIADVSGKGIPAAMYMMKIKHMVMNIVKENLEFIRAIKKINIELCKNNDALMFVTCFIGVLDLYTGKFEYINAGHNQPLLIKNKKGESNVKYIDTPPCSILGIDENANYKVESFVLNEGDMIFMYTDGVTETRSLKREFFGEKRLREFIIENMNKHPKEMCEKLLSDLGNFANGAKQYDDITMLCFKYTGTHNVLELNATYDDVPNGRSFLTNFCNILAIEENEERNIKIVYDEIYSNIIKHAYNNKGGKIIFELNWYSEDGTLEMIFKDYGPEFDSVKYVGKNLAAEDKISGGMGIFFCKNLMDDIVYKRENDMNVLKLYKKDR